MPKRRWALPPSSIDCSVGSPSRSTCAIAASKLAALTGDASSAEVFRLADSETSFSEPELTLPPLRRAKLVAERNELREEIGSGGMGEVWLAHDRELDRAVALKFQGQRAERFRFEREVHAPAGLSHPNIVCIYDYGTAEGRSYLVLEHLPGGTLASRLESRWALDHFEAGGCTT